MRFLRRKCEFPTQSPNRFCRCIHYMEKTFQQILDEKMRSFSAHSPSVTKSQESIRPSVFHSLAPFWSLDIGLTRPRPKSSYPPASPRKPRKELRIPLSQLDAQCLRIVQLWTDLGSMALNHGVNLKLIKRAYRQVAKAIHPDTKTAAMPQEYSFQQLKSDFCRLETACRQLKGSTRDSESASAEECPHRAAA